MNIAAKLSLFVCLVAVTAASANAQSNPEYNAANLEYYDAGNSEYVVVFEAGFGSDATIWQVVIDELDGELRTINYSRAGLGSSPAAPSPRSIEQHISDLKILLTSLEVSANVIMVGHSYGGLIAAEMVQTHPDLIAGLVLVDPATRAQRTVFKKLDAERVSADDEKLIQFMPANLHGDYKSLIDQMDNYIGEVVPLPVEIPVTLFTSTATFEEPFVFEETNVGRAAWLNLHKELLREVKHNTHVLVPDAGHNIHNERPADVSKSILQMSIWLQSNRPDGN